MSSTLFDNRCLTDRVRRQRGESHFRFLNCSGSARANRARTTLESWFSEYQKLQSEADTKVLRRRIRSKNNAIHLSSLTELYIFRLLSLNVYASVVHPRIAGTRKKPDFIALKCERPEFFVEVSVVFDSQNARQDDLGSDDEIAILADEPKPIKDAIDEKANRYGLLNLPYLIVINSMRNGLSASDETIFYALFGRENCKYVLSPDGWSLGSVTRDDKGALIHSEHGYRNRNVSGILAVAGLESLTLEEVQPKLWHHPLPFHPFKVDFLNVEQRLINPSNGKLRTYDSKQR